MTTFSYEADLANPVQKYLARKTFRQVERELQFYEYRVDLYAASKQLGKCVAVELKLTRWARAIEQALVYQLCADIVYVAMPASAKDFVPQAELARYGIGLILVYPKMCREVLAPEQSRVVREDYTLFYKSRLLDGEVV